MDRSRQLRGEARGAQLALWVLVAICVLQGVAAVLVTDGGASPRALVQIAAALAASTGLTVIHSDLIRGSSARARRVVVLTAVVLVCSAALAFTPMWMMGALGAATILLVGRAMWAWVVAVLLMMGPLAIGTGFDNVLQYVFAVATDAVIAYVFYVVSRQSIVLIELTRAREHLARVEVDSERNRIARDLHDILGRTLVAAGLRAQTAIRWLDRDIEKCREQLEEMAESITEGQRQLRGLTRGESIVGLEAELSSAVELLTRLGIEAEIDADPVESHEIGRVAARVVREATTNLLKHATAHRVWITVRTEADLFAVVTIVNDGVRGRRAEGGTGLGDLAGRIQESGGVLEAGPLKGGRFRVSARLQLIPQLRDTDGETPAPRPSRQDSGQVSEEGPRQARNPVAEGTGQTRVRSVARRPGGGPRPEDRAPAVQTVRT